MTDSVQKLEQLVEAVESAGANIAPTYLEYMPLAFAIANECGEAGRTLFHRICRQSEKYDSKDAEKLFSNALQKNNGKSTLGTVWHLAELAGVDVKKLSFTTPSSSHTHTRTLIYQILPRLLPPHRPRLRCLLLSPIISGRASYNKPLTVANRKHRVIYCCWAPSPCWGLHSTNWYSSTMVIKTTIPACKPSCWPFRLRAKALSPGFANWQSLSMMNCSLLINNR